MNQLTQKLKLEINPGSKTRTTEENQTERITNFNDQCPDCGESLQRQGICKFCRYCGWSSCY
jgi:hypothetical protein